MFGTPASSPFGTSSSTPAFGPPSSTTAFGTPSSTPAFGSSSATPTFGTPSSSMFGTGFGSTLFSTPLSQQAQHQTPLFSQPNANQFNFQTPQQQQPQQATPFGQNQMSFPRSQVTTQMAPAPLPFSLADRDIQAIIDAYKEEPGNTKYAFKHLLFSVTDPQYKAKPAGVPDIMWAEAMGKLEGMESVNRERLWPQLIQGFKDLSHRLKLQDEVILSDAERLRTTQSNVKKLQRHFQTDTLPRVQQMKQREQNLQRRLLRVMRIVEALEGKGFRVPLMKGEAELAERLAAITRQLKGSGAELSRRVQNLITISRMQANGFDAIGSVHLPGSTKIQEESLTDMQEVLQQQTEATARLGSVLKRDMRDVEIIMSKDTDISDANQ